MILSSIAPATDFLAQEAAREWLVLHGAERLVPDGSLVEAGVLIERGDYLDVQILVDGRVVRGPAITHACACGEPLARHHQQCIRCTHGTAFCRACGADILAKYRYCLGCAHALAAPFCLPRTAKPAPWKAACPYGCGEPAEQGRMMCAAHWKLLPQVCKARFLSLMAHTFRCTAWEEDMAELIEQSCHAVSEQLMLSYQEKS